MAEPALVSMGAGPVTCKHGPGILQGGLLPTGELMQGLLGGAGQPAGLEPLAAAAAAAAAAALRGRS